MASPHRASQQARARQHPIQHAPAAGARAADELAGGTPPAAARPAVPACPPATGPVPCRPRSRAPATARPKAGSGACKPPGAATAPARPCLPPWTAPGWGCCIMQAAVDGLDGVPSVRRGSYSLPGLAAAAPAPPQGRALMAGPPRGRAVLPAARLPRRAAGPRPRRGRHRGRRAPRARPPPRAAWPRRRGPRRAARSGARPW
jgi:hypothetical protein